MRHLYWNEALIRKYDLQGPRYTSYPTAVEFSEQFTVADVDQAAIDSRHTQRPLSLYFHIPFCAKLCYYCACNKIVTKRREKAFPYLENLFTEMAMQAERFGSGRPVHQLHWGGGTPTFLSAEEMQRLMAETRRHFSLLDHDEGDYSIEIDPREMAGDTLQILRDLGFNRISLGVQDFDPAVQRAVNRIQAPELTLRALEAARSLGFRSINVDLIYGLPLQTPTTFRATVEKIIDFAPDRLSVFNYAHLPQRFMPQQRIRAEQLPPPEAKLEILHNAIDQLVQAGYHFVGMDHFARPQDALATAQQEGRLHRNFQGYTTHGDCDLLAFGVSAISMMNRHYYQNVGELEAYDQSISEGRLPVLRGVTLNEDDLIRREVINRLICDFRLTPSQIESRHHLQFETYFAAEMAILKELADDGLINLKNDLIEVSPPGRLLIRVICKAFDRYRRSSEGQRFSRII